MSDSPPAQEPALLVLGMHRCGTSSIAGALTKLGASAPKSLMPANEYNERGYFESTAMVALNDEILASAGSRWDDWRPLDESWLSSQAAAAFEDRALQTLAGEFGSDALPLCKDPRLCRMMGFWSKIFARAGYGLRVVLPVRSPLEAARSLRQRDGFPISKGLLLWLRHSLEAEAATRGLPRAVLDWSQFLVDWRLAMARVGEQIGLAWPRWSDLSAAEVDAFLSHGLRHNVASKDDLLVHPDVNDWVRRTYEALTMLAADPACADALRALDEVRAEFDHATKIFGGALADFEKEATDASSAADRARQERDAVANERDAVANERDALAGERDRLAGETAQERARADALAAERDALAAERDRLAEEAAGHRARAAAFESERNAIAQARATLEAQLQTAVSENERRARAGLWARIRNKG